jgi:hypothetical protein
MHGPLAVTLRGRGTPPRGFWVIEGALIVAVLALDFVTGPFVQLPLAFVVPVGAAAWYAGAVEGLVLAAALPLARLVFLPLWGVAWPAGPAGVNALLSIVALAGAVLFVRHAVYVRSLWNEARILHGLLPVCEGCGAIRGPDGEWSTLESLLSTHSEARTVRGVCPQCRCDADDASRAGAAADH